MMDSIKTPKGVLRNKALAVISSHDNYPFFSLATLLRGVAWVFKCLVTARSALYGSGLLRSYRLPCAVISVGNLAVGGTGKTPLTIYLANLITDLGYRTVILSRGYKGQFEKQGAVVSDGRSLLRTAEQSGDEPYLMASLLKTIPVIVGSDRVGMGKIAINQFRPDVILLDDAFQHRRLTRDLDIVLLDERAPFGNSFLLPRGPLREPVEALKRSHAIVLTRCSGRTIDAGRQAAKLASHRPVFRAFHQPRLCGVLPAGMSPEQQNLKDSDGLATETMSGRRVFAFAGLARNNTFWNTIRDLSGHLIGSLGFEDHHAYDLVDMQRIYANARKHGCDYLATTDKDFVRLPRAFKSTVPLIVLGIRIEFQDESDALRNFVSQRLSQVLTERRYEQ